MLPLPLVAPRDSHELWFGSPQSYRSSSYHGGYQHNNNNNNNNPETARRQPPHHHGGPPSRALLSSTTPSDSLAALLYEERALRLRKENIASFGCAWIKPAGCPKTMLGMREEAAEREEGLAAAAQEMNAAEAAAAAAAGGVAGGFGDVDAFGDPSQQGMDMGQMGAVDGDGGDELERDLDDDIPEADAGEDDDDDAEGLVEEGEEGYGDDEDVEEALMERNLDDDIPDGFSDGDEGDEDEDDDDFDNQPDLDDEIPVADGGGVAEYGSIMVRDLDDDVPEADEDEEMENDEEEGEWQHTDSEAEDDEDDNANDPFAEHFRATTAATYSNTVTPRNNSAHRGAPPHPPSRARETEAQRRFLQRWSGGGTDLDSSMIMDEDDLQASITSQDSVRRRTSRFGRFGRRGGPRDSLD